MSIAAANCAPAFHLRREIDLADLKRLQEPAVIHEGAFRDSDEKVFHVYTVAGWLDGQNIATIQGGATVGGDTIIISVEDRAEADDMACLGLQDTIDALHSEESKHLDALAAQARLSQVNGVRRMELATSPEKNADFVADTEAIRPLRGDDILLAAGGGVQ